MSHVQMIHMSSQNQISIICAIYTSDTFRAMKFDHDTFNLIGQREFVLTITILFHNYKYDLHSLGKTLEF